MTRPFRLQAVARLREARRDAARAHLADALSAAAVIEGQRDEILRRFAELTEQRRLASGQSDTPWLLNAGRYELTLRADQRAVEENAEKIEHEIDKRRSTLAEADRDVRALELLAERAEREQRAEAARREARSLDEFAGRLGDRQPPATEPLT